MTENETNIDPQFHAIEMVEMKVSGMGNVINNNNSLIILLSPVDEEYHIRHNNGKKMIFPIAVPKALSTLYFYRISSSIRLNPLLDDFIRHYSVVTETNLTHVSITNTENHLTGNVHFRYLDGGSSQFVADIPNLIHVAVRYQLPILLEKELLVNSSRSLKINFEPEPPQEEMMKEMSPYDLFIDYIQSGIYPKDIFVEELDKMISALSFEQIDEISEYAISMERYEWVEWIDEKLKGDKHV